MNTATPIDTGASVCHKKNKDSNTMNRISQSENPVIPVVIQRPLRWIAGFTVALLMAGCNDTPGNEVSSTHVQRSQSYEEQGQYRAAMIEQRNAIQANPGDLAQTHRYARLLLTIGSPSSAQTLLESVSDRHTDETRQLLAQAYLKQGKFVSAETVLASVESPDENPATQGRLLALVDFQNGRTQAAVQRRTQMHEDYPQNSEKTQDLITTLTETGRYQQANALIDRLPEAQKDLPEVNYLAARVDYQNNQLTQAEAHLTQALIDLPSTDMMLQERIQVLELLSSVLTELGRPVEATAYNNIVREANPEAYSAQQQYREAITAASRGDVLSAKNAFQDILNQFPANRNAGMMLGLLTLQDGEVTEGEQLLSEHLDPETAPATFVQAAALAQVELGRSQEALDVLSTALLARPDDADLLALYGALLLRDGRSQLGIQTLSKALELEPDRTRLMLMLAQYYADRDQPQLALGHLRKAYSINPADWLTTQFYVSTLVAEDEIEEAQRIASELTGAYPEEPNPYWISSMLDYRAGNANRALVQMTSLLEDHPEFTEAYPTTAQLMRQQGQTLAATDLLMRGYQAIPERPDLLEAALQWRTDATSATDTLAWLREQAAASPQDVALELNSVAMNRLLALGEWNQAGELASQYQDSEQPRARAMTGQYFQARAQQAASQGNWADASRWIKQAELRQPNDLPTQFLAAQIDNSQGNSQDAQARLDTLLASRPDNLNIVAQKARLMAANNNRADALDFVRPYWTRSPSRELAAIYTALISDLEPERLVVALEQWHQVDANAAAPWFMKGNHYLNQQAHAEAISAYRETVRRDASHVAALNNLAWLLREDSPTEALDLAARAADIAPENPGILDTYGWLLHLNGEHQQAVTVLTRARQLAPNNADIEQHLQEAEASNAAPA